MYLKRYSSHLVLHLMRQYLQGRLKTKQRTGPTQNRWFNSTASSHLRPSQPTSFKLPVTPKNLQPDYRWITVVVAEASFQLFYGYLGYWLLFVIAYLFFIFLLMLLYKRPLSNFESDDVIVIFNYCDRLLISLYCTASNPITRKKCYVSRNQIM